MSLKADLFTSIDGTPVASLYQTLRGVQRIVQMALAVPTTLLLLGACTRMLELPPPEVLPSPAGPILDVTPVTDDRTSPRLGKLDTLTIDSGPDLVRYLEAELINGLARMGFAVRQVDPHTAPTGNKRLQVSLLSAELESESTALMPVAAAVRFRVELTDESGQSTFRNELRRGRFHLPERCGKEASVGGDRGGREAPSTSCPADGRRDVEERLTTLDRLLEEGLNDRDDYTAKRQEIRRGL